MIYIDRGVVYIFTNLLHVIADNFDKVYEKYKGIVRAVCFRILKNEHDVCDASQDTFLKLSQNLHLLKDKTLERDWVIEAARCSSLDLIRKREKTVDTMPLEKVESFLASEEKNPETLIIGEEAVERIYEAMDSLDEKYKTVLIYRYYFEFRNKEIAKLLGINKDTVATRLCRGTELLRAKLYKASKKDEVQV